MAVLTAQELRRVRNAVIRAGKRLIPELDIAALGTKAQIETGIQEMDAELELHVASLAGAMSPPMSAAPNSYKGLVLALIALERAGLLDNLAQEVRS